MSHNPLHRIAKLRKGTSLVDDFPMTFQDVWYQNRVGEWSKREVREYISEMLRKYGTATYWRSYYGVWRSEERALKRSRRISGKIHMLPCHVAMRRRMRSGS